MKIYIDLIFFQDTIIMMLILFLYSKLINIKVSIPRILTVSVVSSIISIIILVYSTFWYDNLLQKIILGILIIKFTFNLKSKEEFIPMVILLWIITILYGGIGLVTEGNISQTILLLIITIIVLLKYKNQNKKTLLLEAATCFIEFNYKGINYKFKSLLDTGHDVKTIYEEDIIFVKENLFNEKGGENKSKRIVSYKTVSGIDTKIGIKINNIKITYGQKTVHNNAVIVSTPNISNQFDAIVGFSLIEGGWSYGNINFNETKGKKIVS